MDTEGIKDQIRRTAERLKALIQERANNLVSQLENNPPSSADTVKFNVDSSIEVACKSYGSLCFADVSPSATYVLGKGVRRALVDEAAYIEVHLTTSDGSTCYDDVPIQVDLYNPSEKHECRGERVRARGGIHKYRYVPLEPGCHKLHIAVAGEQIRNSPYSVNVGMPIHIHFVPSVVLEDFYRPAGLACGPQGELAVVDNRGYDTLLLYNSQLESMMKCAPWGSYYTHQCYEPIGVAFDKEGSMLVVDGKNHRIQKYNRQGEHVKSIGGHGKGPRQFIRPTGIGVSKVGLVYVCDRTNNRVQILKPNLAFNKEFGGYGDAPCSLYNPWDVAFDSQGFVYIVDAGHQCIKKFTPDGEFREQIGSSALLQCPLMICIDEYDHLYVTDSDAHQVVVFDCYGNHCFSFGEYGTGKGQFIEPRGIALGKNGELFVSDVGNKRVIKFQ